MTEEIALELDENDWVESETNGNELYAVLHTRSKALVTIEEHKGKFEIIGYPANYNPGSIRTLSQHNFLKGAVRNLNCYMENYQ